jgi:hypothetical protein
MELAGHRPRSIALRDRHQDQHEIKPASLVRHFSMGTAHGESMRQWGQKVADLWGF